MSEQDVNKRWLMFCGKRKRPPEIIKRTENGVRYEMSARFNKRYQGWATKERDLQRPYSFTEFYKTVLPKGEQEQISVTIVNQDL